MASGGSHYLWANVTWQSFRAKWQELNERGLRLIDFEIVNPDGGNAADFADGPADAMDAADPLEFEEFGGIFGEDPAPDETANEEGGGGIGDAHDTPQPVIDDGEGGGVYFADEIPQAVANPHDDTEPADGYGDVVLSQSTPDDDEGQGGSYSS